MFSYLWNRTKRNFFPAIVVIGFASILTVVLCSFHASLSQAQAAHDEILKNTKVTCRITDLSGEHSTGLEIPNLEINQFTGEYAEFSSKLKEFVDQVELTGSMMVLIQGEEHIVTGITSLRADSILWPENGCTIFWNPGYDETCWETGENLLLLSQKQYEALDENSLTITFTDWNGNEYSNQFQVAGVYYGLKSEDMYCPWNAFSGMAKAAGVYCAKSLQAVVRDNSRLPELKAAAALLFAEPDPRNGGREIDFSGQFSRALDINDDLLQESAHNLSNRMRVNRLVSALVYALSIAAGSLIGFLTIRNQKHEIILMRTLGTRVCEIFLGFGIEQLIYVGMGLLLGGFWFRFRPAGQLIIFAVLYLVGLIAALSLYLRSNLIKSIKEDE